MQNFSLDQLLETYKAFMPKTVYLMKNKKRYDDIVKAVCEIASCAVDVDSDAKVKIFPDDLTGTSLCLQITASLVVIDLLDKFCSALKKASNLEVYPRTDGLIGLGVVFEDAFVPAPAHESSKEVRR